MSFRKRKIVFKSHEDTFLLSWSEHAANGAGRRIGLFPSKTRAFCRKEKIQGPCPMGEFV